MVGTGIAVSSTRSGRGLAPQSGRYARRPYRDRRGTGRL